MLCYDGGEADAHRVVEAGVVIAREAGFTPEALLLAADRKTAELIAATAEELDAPAIVIGQLGLSGLKNRPVVVVRSARARLSHSVDYQLWRQSLDDGETTTVYAVRHPIRRSPMTSPGPRPAGS